MALRFQEEEKEKRKCLKLNTPGILSGKMFYAREAVAVGLIDEIGTLGTCRRGGEGIGRDESY